MFGKVPVGIEGQIDANSKRVDLAVECNGVSTGSATAVPFVNYRSVVALSE